MSGKSWCRERTLIDNEKVDWANTSRHSLGAVSVGESKAKALAHELQTNYPHLKIVGHESSVINCLRTLPTLEHCTLLVSLTAHWATDQALSLWRRSNTDVGLIYGWTEAHACAGHAVLIDDSSTIESGFSSTGVPKFSVTEWPADPNLQEPACGATFQPYGAVEVGSTITLVAGLALDYLLTKPMKSVHRFWVGPQSLLRSSGGQWSMQWKGHPEFRDCGSLVVEKEWPHSTSADSKSTHD